MDDLKLYSKSERTLDSLIQTVRIFSLNIGMQFGMNKWVMLRMKTGKIMNLEPLNDKVIKLLKEGENYKYLGELEEDEMMVIKMKDKMKKEYDRRARKELKTNLNRQNVFKAIKIWQYQW